MSERRFGVLISGRGSNMVALVDAAQRGDIPARPAVVISNRAQAPGLELAADRGVETLVIRHQEFGSRELFDRAVVAALQDRGVELVCLAGFMRLLSPFFVRSFTDRIINIHPSLLPSFPGLHVQQQALDHGAKVSGCTVHFVDEDLDAGPIIVQRTVPILEGDDADILAGRILDEEHRVYTDAVRLYFEDRLTVEGRVVRIRQE
jgi:phosphoribosylglycinamide formyltransferase-1